MTIGENLKHIRTKKGLTQKRLGELCEMDAAQIRRYESGKVEPRTESLERIANALGVSPYEIRYGEEPPQKLDMVSSFLDGENATLAMLRTIYSSVQLKSAIEEETAPGYVLIKNEKEQFVLYDSDIDTIYSEISHWLPLFVDKLKDTRQEDEIIAELAKKLGAPPITDKE